MLSDIYYRKKIGVPWISLLFFLSCILVSIPTFFNPRLYFVFGGQHYDYFWQYFTHIFEHGSAVRELYGFGANSDPILFHLMGNSLAILITGILAERVLGTKRFFVLIITNLIAYYILIFSVSIQGNGASALTYSFPPIAAMIMFYSYKLNGKRVLKDWVFYLAAILLLVGWIGVTVSYAIRGAWKSNLIHLTSTAVGVFFAFIWRKRIFSRIREIENYNTPAKIASSKTGRLITGAGFLVPLFIICILALSFMGAFNIQAFSTVTYDVTPSTGSVTDINKNNNEIIIKFSEPVGDFNSISYESLCLDEQGGMPYECKRVDAQTFKFSFGRDFYDGEKIKITVERLFDSHERYFDKNIVIDYQ